MILQIDKICEYSSSLLTKLQARKELNRIEDRYVKRNNRNIWKSEAEYIDGEYVYTCHQQVAPPVSQSHGKKSDASSPKTPDAKSPSFSTSRPATDSSSASEASKRSGSSTPSRLAKRFSTSMPWR